MRGLNLLTILFITNMAVDPFTYRHRQVHEFLALSNEKTIHTPKWTAMPSIFVNETTMSVIFLKTMKRVGYYLVAHNDEICRYL